MINKIKMRDELLAMIPHDMSAEEYERYRRIVSIPDVAYNACIERIAKLRQRVIETEAEMDALNDYINGFLKVEEIKERDE